MKKESFGKALLAFIGTGLAALEIIVLAVLLG
jgi:hypothetical protein